VSPQVVFFSQCVVALPIYVVLLSVRQRLFGGPGMIELIRSWKQRVRQHLAAGTLAYLSYLLILWAYESGGDVAAVTAAAVNNRDAFGKSVFIENDPSIAPGSSVGTFAELAPEPIGD